MNSQRNDIADFENLMSLSSPVKSKASTRWERRDQRTVSSQPCTADRYIPNRSAMDYDIHKLDENMDKSSEASDHSKLLSAALDQSKDQARVLAFKSKAPVANDGYQSSLKVLYTASGPKKEVARSVRHIPSAPLKVLDAPDMRDDYYLNLLSWGTNNLLAVALGSTVYNWDPASGMTTELMSLDEGDYVSSVAWLPGGNHLAVGTSASTVQLWDVSAGRQLRSLKGHAARVGALAWNSHLLSSGSKDNSILHHDVRIQEHIVSKMLGHSQEVCGLAWSPDGSQLASGANDNLLCISDATGAVRHTFAEHQAAVKALAWSPHERNLLASGGGTADRCIKFFNTSSGTMVNSIDTGSQVCALQWSPFEKELLSSHGYAENQLCLWSYPSMLCVKELKAHTSRVLHMAVSPDGTTVCSGAPDETLRFWKVFASETVSRKRMASDLLMPPTALGTAGIKTPKAMRIR